MSRRQKVIAVDFDGTLVTTNDYDEFEMIPDAAKSVQKLMDEGYRIVIHTSRMGIAARHGRLDEEIELVEGALRRFRIPYDEIYVGKKFVADLYIDDRNVAYNGDWNECVKLCLDRKD
jgi:HAD superfamily hydrolase (TIGR01662 family)